MTPDTTLLLSTAAGLGVLHTVLGPDHYVPFIALGRARGWTMRRTLLTTLVCGVGHVLSSILIGVAGLLLGTRLLKLETLEAQRGELAAWLLLGFGLAYLAWGLRRALRPMDTHKLDKNSSTVAWALFIVFVLGPCEPLIPLLMIPAASISALSLLLVSGVFLFFTVATMLTMVAIGVRGFSVVSWPRIARFSHALAGGALASCAAAMLFLGS